ncbi:MAG: hypothetical protein H6742_00480 [Alphaproteobacteria bacterium]|nr:hypothetical protein [Alphaproteobacteria bacterium]
MRIVTAEVLVALLLTGCGTFAPAPTDDITEQMYEILSTRYRASFIETQEGTTEFHWDPSGLAGPRIAAVGQATDWTLDANDQWVKSETIFAFTDPQSAPWLQSRDKFVGGIASYPTDRAPFAATVGAKSTGSLRIREFKKCGTVLCANFSFDDIADFESDIFNVLDWRLNLPSSSSSRTLKRVEFRGKISQIGTFTQSVCERQNLAEPPSTITRTSNLFGFTSESYAVRNADGSLTQLFAIRGEHGIPMGDKIEPEEPATTQSTSFNEWCTNVSRYCLWPFQCNLRRFDYSATQGP